MYSKGSGVSKDYVKGYSRLLAAVAAKNYKAKQILAELKEKLNQQELAEAIQYGERLSMEYGK